jgi:hypothetical protein
LYGGGKVIHREAGYSWLLAVDKERFLSGGLALNAVCWPVTVAIVISMNLPLQFVVGQKDTTTAESVAKNTNEGENYPTYFLLKRDLY